MPRLLARDLNGDPHTLPDELQRPALLLIAFEQEQQPRVDEWLTAARGPRCHDQPVEVYELPVVLRRYLPMRPLLDRWMRDGVRDRSGRAHVLTIYVDRARFCRQLGIPDAQVSAVLVDSTGSILWRHTGRPDLPALSDALRRVTPAARTAEAPRPRQANTAQPPQPVT